MVYSMSVQTVCIKIQICATWSHIGYATVILRNMCAIYVKSRSILAPNKEGI